MNRLFIIIFVYISGLGFPSGHINGRDKMILTMKNIILVLGAPNDENGDLSQIALDRLDCALNLYIYNENVRFICTGGFGEQFNTTSFPHGYYSKQYLFRKGVREEAFFEFVLSSNTVEDLRMSKQIIEKEQPDVLLIVSSDFHMKRVKILHDIIIHYPATVFIPALSSLPAQDLVPFLQHEQQAVRELQANNYILY